MWRHDVVGLLTIASKQTNALFKQQQQKYRKIRIEIGQDRVGTAGTVAQRKRLSIPVILLYGSVSKSGNLFSSSCEGLSFLSHKSLIVGGGEIGPAKNDRSRWHETVKRLEREMEMHLR